MSHIYPPLTPYMHDWLDVGQGHQIYFEQSGNPDGIPLLYLHGGPGAGLSSIYRCLFDPEKYRIIGFDQRGSGKSIPALSLYENHTDALLADIQCLRKHLSVEKWVLCGGSWGATLALLCAINHPRHVSAIVLRGVFLGRSSDIDWFLNADGGAAQVFPEYYAAFTRLHREADADESLLEHYHRLLCEGDELSRLAAAKAWCLWEERISTMDSSINEHDLCLDLHRAKSLALMEAHYLINHCFIEDNYILDNLHKINSIPGTIIHGRFDMVCKLEAAYSLRQAWRNSQLLIVPESGHSVSETRVAEAVCHASDAMAKFITEGKH